MSAPQEIQYDQEDATAMRSYLQRAEVRLSTMHRIAGAFLSGAGLLILLPVLIKDSIANIVQGLYIDASATSLILYVLPYLLSLVIPLYALWLLFRDLCVFYFTSNIPSALSGDSQQEAFHPRFSLTAIPFSDVKEQRLKKEIRRIQFATKLRFFLLPYSQDAKDWLNKVSESAEGKKVELPDDEWLPKPQGDDHNALRVAFGIAGAYNRNLIEECAKSELSLIRHNLHLRRLVMRYMKALLILIWTALITIVIVAVLEATTKDKDIHTKLLIISACNAVWASLTPWIVRAPVRWIYDEFDQNTSDSTRDPQVVHFEQRVVAICFVAFLLAALGCYLIIGLSWWYAGGLIPLVCLVKSRWAGGGSYLRWV